MKIKITILLAAILSLSSCYTSRNLNTKEELDSNVNNAILYLSSIGFHQNGENLDTKNELVVEGVSYSTVSGYGTRMGNNIVYNDWYSFVNSAGNTVEFTVSYQAWFADQDSIVEYDTYDTIAKSQHQDIGGYRPPTERKVVKKRHHVEYPRFIAVDNVEVPQCKTSLSSDFERICNTASPVKSINKFKSPKRARVKK